MKILITGASGLVGRSLMRFLLNQGHDVFALVRSPSKITEIKPQNIFAWDFTQIPDLKALKGMDAVIHLIGESVADKRWTEARKKELKDSRVISTRNLVSAFGKLEKQDRPNVFISTSGTGFYGDTGDTITDESGPLGNDFLAGICKEWEAEAHVPAELGMRFVIMRFGLVLSSEGGFLSKMAPVVLGSGQQWMSWIHIYDIHRFIIAAVENDKMQGEYNLVSETPVTNKDLTKTYAKVKGFPFTLSAPAFGLKIALGELSSAVLASQRIIPKRLLESGFKFQFSSLEKALEDVYSSKKEFH